jgi:hypothetical protein
VILPVPFDPQVRLLVTFLTFSFHKQADPSRETIDPDELIVRLTAYNTADDTNEDGENNFKPIFDFFARYVRKLHSDRHIKSTLSSSPGMSFLDMISPSNVAYIALILKNSKAMWLQPSFPALRMALHSQQTIGINRFLISGEGLDPSTRL